MLSGNFAEMTTSKPFRDLLHAANVRHGTDGFTSPPREGVLRIFFALKNRRLRPGLNPRTWKMKASTLPLDHILLTKYVVHPLVKIKMTLLGLNYFKFMTYTLYVYDHPCTIFPVDRFALMN